MSSICNNLLYYLSWFALLCSFYYSLVVRLSIHLSIQSVCLSVSVLYCKIKWNEIPSAGQIRAFCRHLIWRANILESRVVELLHCIFIVYIKLINSERNVRTLLYDGHTSIVLLPSSLPGIATHTLEEQLYKVIVIDYLIGYSVLCRFSLTVSLKVDCSYIKRLKNAISTFQGIVL